MRSEEDWRSILRWWGSIVYGRGAMWVDGFLHRVSQEEVGSYDLPLQRTIS